MPGSVSLLARRNLLVSGQAEVNTHSPLRRILHVHFRAPSSDLGIHACRPVARPYLRDPSHCRNPTRRYESTCARSACIVMHHVLQRGFTLLPRIARQVRHDVVVPRAGCRIDGDLGQRPTEASSGPVTPNRPEVGARDYADVGITLSDGKRSRRTLAEPPDMAPVHVSERARLRLADLDDMCHPRFRLADRDASCWDECVAIRHRVTRRLVPQVPVCGRHRRIRQPQAADRLPG